MKTKTLDQSEAFALRDQLLLRSRTLTAALETATAKKVDEPKLSSPTTGGTVIADIDLLQSHCELLQREISAACKPQAAAPTAPAPASTSAAPAQAHTVAKKPLTPDERLWALHGVKSAEELNAKIDRERALGLHKDIGD